MKGFQKGFLVFCAACLLSACGSQADLSDGDGTRLISGTISQDASASVDKSLGDASGCIGDICGVQAQNEKGEMLEGEVDPATHRWQIRVHAGNWMFGFMDGDGNRLGLLAMNGILAITVEEGEDVDLGSTQLRQGLMVMTQDKAHLGTDGLYAFRGQYGDRDRDGIPAEFDPDEDLVAYDSSVFEVIFVRPFDEQPEVIPCRPIKVVFTQAVDVETLNEETFIVELSDGTPVEGTIALFEDEELSVYEAKFLPIGGYPLGETIFYTLVAGPNGILSAEGEALSEDVTGSFTVREEANTSDTCHDPDEEMYQLRIQDRIQQQDQVQQQDQMMDGQADS